jgi:hypothetical protein
MIRPCSRLGYARLFCFVRIRAQVSYGALGTPGPVRDADAAAVILHQVAKAHPLFLGNNFDEISFDFVGIGLGGETKSLRETHHVRIDADGLFAEGVSKNNIRGLSADAREADEILQVVGHVAAEALHEFFAAIVNRFAFVTIEIDLADLPLESGQRRTGVISRRAIGFEQLRCYFVDQIVAGLGSEDQGDQELQWIGEVEIELGVGMNFFQTANDLFDSRLFSTDVRFSC